MTDPYCYPSSFVLKNKAGIKNPDKAQEFERTQIRLRSRQPLPPDITPDEQGFRALHHHLFQDVYDWAGKSRIVEMEKQTTLFCPSSEIDDQMRILFDDLFEDHHKGNLRDPTLAPELFAKYTCRLNAIHPFREGNGRALRTFIDHLARQNGFTFDRTKIDRVPWMASSLAGMKENYKPMTKLMGKVLIPLTQQREIAPTKTRSKTWTRKPAQKKSRKRGVSY